LHRLLRHYEYGDMLLCELSCNLELRLRDVLFSDSLIYHCNRPALGNWKSVVLSSMALRALGKRSETYETRSSRLLSSALCNFYQLSSNPANSFKSGERFQSDPASSDHHDPPSGHQPINVGKCDRIPKKAWDREARNEVQILAGVRDSPIARRFQQCTQLGFLFWMELRFPIS